MKKEHNMNIFTATNDPIITWKQTKFYKVLEELHAKTIFKAVETSSGNIFIVTYFTDRYVKSTYHKERRHKLRRCKPIAVHSREAPDKLEISTTPLEQVKECNDSNDTHGSEAQTAFKLRVTKQTLIKPNTM